MERFNIKNKNILIAGGSGQIGKNIIDFFLKLNARIINLDIQDIEQKKIKSNRNYLFYKIDFSKKEDIDLIFSKFIKKKTY